MFEALSPVPGDRIFALLAEYRADPRPEKINLGIGVYKDEKGRTPVMTAIAKAEQRVLANTDTFDYVGVAGNKGFVDAMVDLALGDAAPKDRLRGAQAPGGTGALWILMSLANRARPGGTIHLSDPTWVNHIPMSKGVGLKVAFYPYFDVKTRNVRFAEMLAYLDQLGPDDIVLLHGCCHNPTGANLTDAQWDQVTESLVRTGAFPLIDLAYIGFGDGLAADTYGTRKVVASVPESMVALSCSKNFGLYKERAGAAILIGRDAKSADISNGNMLNIIRGCYSQPPDHGAEIVRTVLTDPALRAEWEAELDQMRGRMIGLREKLAAAIRQKTNSDEFDFVATHRGMFSLLGLGPKAVESLRLDQALYLIDDSRINVAGIPEDKIDQLADLFIAAAKK